MAEKKKAKKTKPAASAPRRVRAAEKVSLKPGNLLYPLPAVMVSCGETDGASDIVTIAWTGTVCSDPAMVFISVRPTRHSYAMIKERGEFVINLVSEDLVRAMDYCGVRSGRDTDKWTDCRLTPVPADTVACPIIAEAPVNIECKVESVTPLGSHDMFVARVTAVHADASLMDEKGALDLSAARLISYNHGEYTAPGKKKGSFGFSVRKKTAAKPKAQKSKNAKAK